MSMVRSKLLEDNDLCLTESCNTSCINSKVNMPGPVEHRASSGIINLVRKWLRGGDFVNALRFADLIAARTQPPPEIPGGPYHKTSKIYYFTRDARREVTPPTVISTNQQIATSGQVSTEVKPTTPGKVWEWN